MPCIREGYGESEKSYVEDPEVSDIYHARPAAPAILNQVDGRSPGKLIHSIRRQVEVRTGRLADFLMSP